MRRSLLEDLTSRAHWAVAFVARVLARQPSWAIVVESMVIVAAVAVLDSVHGAELSFSLLYIVPVLLVTWLVSLRAGLVVAALASVLWGVVDSTYGRGYSAVWHGYWNVGARFAFHALVAYLISRLGEQSAHDRELLRTDALTGVSSGRAFDERVELSLESMRRSGRPLTIAYIDLDRFKEVNDTHGHHEGDRALKTVADAIRSRVRRSDLVARLGGDEFAVLLPDTDADGARAVMEAVSQEVHSAVEGRWDLGLTVGAVTFVSPPNSVVDMVRLADALMYQGKRSGRGRIVSGSWGDAGAECIECGKDFDAEACDCDDSGARCA